MVFYSLDGETRHVASIEPHTLVNPKLEGNTLSFQVRRLSGDLISIRVSFTSAGKAQLHCLNCGDSPVAELTKDTL